MSPSRRRWVLPLCALALAAGILIGRWAGARWMAWAGLALALSGCAQGRERLRLAGIGLSALLLGCLLGGYAYHPALPEEGSYTVSGVVAEELRVDGNHVRTVLRSVTLNGERLPGGAYWSYYGDVPENLAPGVRVTLTANLYHPAGPSNPGGYDFREALLQQRVTVGVYGQTELTIAPAEWNLWGVTASLRHRLAERLTDSLGEETGGYAVAMLLGLRSQVEEADQAAFRRLGIAHVLAVSGAHTAVLAGMLLWLLNRLHAGRKLRFILLSLTLACYCLLTGGNAPVVRASLLLVLGQLAYLRRRQPVLLWTLCAAFCIQLTANSTLLTSAGFQLTYAAMAGIALVTPWLERKRPRHCPRRLWSGIAASMGAQLGILLPEMYWFQRLPLLGLALNVIIIPLFGVILGCMWGVLLLLPIAPVAAWAGQTLSAGFSRLLAGLRWLDAHGSVSLWTRQADGFAALGWALAIFALSLWWPRSGWRRGAAVTVAVLLLLVPQLPWPSGEVSYVQLAVGSADAAVLRDRGDVTVIDTGEDGQSLAAYLRQRRLGIDRLVLTHLHMDHAGGVTTLLEAGIPIGECLLPWGAEDALVDAAAMEQLEALRRVGVPVRAMGRGESVSLPDGEMIAVWPESGMVRPGQDANESSLVLRATVRGTSLLLTGDLDGRYEMYSALPADVLKVAHHGSKSSTSPAFLEAVRPSVLLLSCGDQARADSMAERAGDIPLRVTRRDGALTLRFAEDGFTVSTYLSPATTE